MRHVTLLFTSGDCAIVFLSARILSDDPVIVQAVKRNLAIDVRHVPMDPGATDFVVEAVYSCVPCASPESITGFNEECFLACEKSIIVYKHEKEKPDLEWLSLEMLQVQHSQIQ
jgi:hypothetical protein